MSWTDDRVELLRKLWGEGKTAAEIANVLGGVTRNAVIGKAHRLKLSGRVSPIQQNKKQKPVKPANESQKIKKPRKPVHDEAADLARDKIDLIDLKSSQCKWPIGDPKEENFGFCGCTRMAGLPYCAEHAKVAYQASTRNKILKAEDLEKHEADQLERIQNQAAG